MPIESLPPSARDYLAAFDLAAVAISPTGRVFTSRNPVGASAAFWCRAGEADKVTKRIDEAIARAKADGLLTRFHQEYKQRRLQAKARGEPFLSFGEAERRLRKLLADSIVAGGTIPQSFTEVFDR
jgi:hypothetical protein